MATLTKKDLLEAIEDMPLYTPVKAIIRLEEYHSLVCPNLKVEISNGTIIIKNNPYDS